ncbi:MAG TPA: HPr family phosphocarrier protein [Candidatus Blautia faecavium]|uniref:HPr family phosphocarrier protein n=1 Tax=Candidatus Blautia faecavium TaxID=2838487 RepID=A0A9D2LQD8_9FIRM|nr:HPr family phosphocarrier protein [Candidatus Blautia faecavium]
MITEKVLLNTIEAVKEFVDIVSRYDVDMELVSGRYVIDAKSIMGIFSIDLSSPIALCIHENREEAEEILGRLKKFIV